MCHPEPKAKDLSSYRDRFLAEFTLSEVERARNDVNNTGYISSLSYIVNFDTACSVIFLIMCDSLAISFR